MTKLFLITKQNQVIEIAKNQQNQRDTNFEWLNLSVPLQNSTLGSPTVGFCKGIFYCPNILNLIYEICNQATIKPLVKAVIKGFNNRLTKYYYVHNLAQMTALVKSFICVTYFKPLTSHFL